MNFYLHQNICLLTTIKEKVQKSDIITILLEKEIPVNEKETESSEGESDSEEGENQENEEKQDNEGVSPADESQDKCINEETD